MTNTDKYINFDTIAKLKNVGSSSHLFGYVHAETDLGLDITYTPWAHITLMRPYWPDFSILRQRKNEGLYAWRTRVARFHTVDSYTPLLETSGVERVFVPWSNISYVETLIDGSAYLHKFYAWKDQFERVFEGTSSEKYSPQYLFDQQQKRWELEQAAQQAEEPSAELTEADKRLFSQVDAVISRLNQVGM